MLWGSGRLLLRAGSLARTRPLVAVYLVVVLIGAGVLCALPGSRPGRHESARSFGSVSVSSEAAVGSGTVSVSIAKVHHFSPGTLPAPAPEQRFALLVGINHAVGGTPLEGAVTDALNVKQALLDYGFPPGNITTLLDAQASRAAILQGLDNLVKSTPPSGVAVVAIAAHSRPYGGIDQLLAADGLRVNSTEIASRLQHLRSRAWIALPTCFAGGYALPGIVGHNRIATFASDAGSESYEVGDAGSYLIIDMVREAMIERRAPESVESAFNWAHDSLERTNPNRVPSMSDGVDGDLVLGDMPGAINTSAAPPPRQNASYEAQPYNGGSQYADDPSTEQGSGSSDGESNGGYRTVEVCGRASFRCSQSP